jgi:hypothetical protein
VFVLFIAKMRIVFLGNFLNSLVLKFDSFFKIFWEFFIIIFLISQICKKAKRPPIWSDGQKKNVMK